jgi:hypothetical protein
MTIEEEWAAAAALCLLGGGHQYVDRVCYTKKDFTAPFLVDHRRIVVFCGKCGKVPKQPHSALRALPTADLFSYRWLQIHQPSLVRQKRKRNKNDRKLSRNDRKRIQWEHNQLVWTKVQDGWEVRGLEALVRKSRT